MAIRTAILTAIISVASLLSVALVAQSVPWIDPSPHAQRFVQVEPGVRLEVLDWGGSGRALVLLAQLGQSAHIYDDWAPQLRRTHRVLSISRRGYGESTGETSDYSAERLGRDVVAVLDAENLRAPVLVGNGFAGEELSWIGARFPNRLGGLIYLDAAYDRGNISAESTIAERIPPRVPQPNDLESATAMTRWVSDRIGFPLPEAEVRQIVRFGSDGHVAGERTPVAVRKQILAGIVKADYRNIRVPVLAIYAKPTSSNSLPGCRAPDDEKVHQSCDQLYSWGQQHLSTGQKLFRTIPAEVRIVEIVGAHPFIFLSHQAEVNRAVDDFVSKLPR